MLPNTALLRKVKKKESYEILQVLVGFIAELPRARIARAAEHHG